ncbi:MAG: hypothetical protein PQJ61_02165 [Spirochaetales bacterium]|uniref:DUF5723 domain-containing protein n=1 Tax=Candidatus Thalassospirochaeta sargassi TaxID=3119039 RepID=A0AAJ1ICF1_9SPIO|nr:hypothetical protein [Spirochaetales bacterium]
MHRKLIVLLIMILIGFSAFAEADYYAEGIYVGTAVDYGLGGPYPTDNDGLETIFANPAGFRTAEEDFTFSNLTFHMMGPVFDIAEIVTTAMSGEGEFTDILLDSTVQEMLSNIYTGIKITGPVNFGYIGEGFGFGLFNTTDVLIEGTGPLSLAVGVSEDLLLAGGYSFRIPLTRDEKHAIDIGFMLKGGVEGDLTIEKSFLELAGTEFGLELLTDSPLDVTALIGVDAGIQYYWDGIGSIGIAALDIYTPTMKNTYENGITGFMASEEPATEIGLVPMNLNAGFEFNPDFDFLEKFLTDFRLMAAYDDILDFWLYPSEAEHWMLHLKAGTELTLLEILDIRVGVADGLLNAGVGLDLKIFKINAAMFGTERASQPDTSPVYNLALGFNF